MGQIQGQTNTATETERDERKEKWNMTETDTDIVHIDVSHPSIHKRGTFTYREKSRTTRPNSDKHNCLFVSGFTIYQQCFSYLTAKFHKSMFLGLFNQYLTS